MMLGIMLPLVVLPLLSIFVYGFGKDRGCSGLRWGRKLVRAKLSMVTSFWATAFNVLFVCRGLRPFALRLLGTQPVIVTSLYRPHSHRSRRICAAPAVGKIRNDRPILSENQQIMFTRTPISGQTSSLLSAGFRSNQPVFDTMSRSLERSIGDDRATRLQTFWHVTLPSLRGAIVSGALLTFARAVGECGSTILRLRSSSGRNSQRQSNAVKEGH